MAQNPLPQQAAIINHPPDRHGRVLAGPGTGKSSTVLRLAQALANLKPSIRARIVTFTRAATAELVDKIREQGHEVEEPSTLHSFALSVLMRYVAMTRPRECLYLTMASERTGPTARTGAPNVGRSRGRCPFFQPLGQAFAPQAGLNYLASIGA